MISTTLIPVNVSDGKLFMNNDTQLEEVTLSSLNVKEAELEEFVRKNISEILPDDETLLIVGQQAQNQKGGRADLVAVNGDGNVILIELKRDKDDISARKEPFEFQAIRYAANYALISTPQELVQKLYAPYIERHSEEHPQLNPLTPSELATRLLNDFLAENQSERNFNEEQKIILIAASYDEQTLSACAWLAKGGIDIRCLSITPLAYQNSHVLAIEQIIPPPLLDAYFVEVAGPSAASTQSKSGLIATGKKQYLPRMPRLLEWGLISKGQELLIKNYPDAKAQVVDAQTVQYQGQALNYNSWGQKITGWSAINIYEWAVHVPTGKTLDDLRREKLKELEDNQSSDASQD